ncbi:MULTISPECIES: DUF6461 domain-containing protein [Streptomyces]|uniref:Uncharacterized protein n=3 Tax=Streptomyces rimosus TaxID=1927 RepID=L8F085_STRR1|nr:MULTISPECIES: DUF6461 domain-containing protein [Streptomyces]KOG73084.1 hypothetical protein ADK78_17655 [Kitasatospora aureofaciens]MYT42063.1 hypothetical protein [Streptomyces sp. SID5471]KEF04853.1 hypothetical protein DF17_21655 [Streptomyces rimosus]KEF10909.1 hypothetical protein DF18_36410 [Streptomyces rimosus]KOT38632.1 hypothetical protein ADK42_16935 [Streptomyces rimosus subsp. rimosus]
MNPLAWIADEYPTHCLTLGRGLAGRELLSRLGASPTEMFRPHDEDEANEFVWAGMEDYWNWGAARAGEACGWAYVLEPASMWGSLSERLKAASSGTEVICCSYADAMETIAYWRDGVLLAQFETLSPQQRSGQEPDILEGPMRRAGLEDSAPAGLGHPGLAVLHEATGVALSQEETVLAWTGKLPAMGLGPEAAAEDSSGPSPNARSADASGGPVGLFPTPRPAGCAKAAPGQGRKRPGA